MKPGDLSLCFPMRGTEASLQCSLETPGAPSPARPHPHPEIKALGSFRALRTTDWRAVLSPIVEACVLLLNGDQVTPLGPHPGCHAPLAGMSVVGSVLNVINSIYTIILVVATVLEK